VLLAACVDGPTSPGRFGELRIRPVYPQGDAPAVLSLTVDSAKVRATRIDEPGTTLVDTTVRYDSDTLSLGWVLDLQDEQERLRVNVEIYDGGALVYSGAADVLVREEDISTSGAEAVLVAYVGPPVVATVSVTPGSATLEALGASATFAAEARDRNGVVVPVALTWSSADAAVATVDAATGVVTAIANGTASITAAAGGVTGAAAIRVAQRMATLAVTPQAPTLAALGATQQLSASARDANGHPVADVSVAWTSSDPGIATVDAGGSVTAVSGGTATITAMSGGVSGSTLVTVSPVTNVATIIVTPGHLLRTARGATAQFTAQARDAGGNVLEGVPFTWSSSAPDVATVDAATGLATVTGHGSTLMTASANGVTASATLEANLSSSVATVLVSPAAAALTAVGAQQPFTAQALDAGGAPVPGVTAAWSSSAPTVGTIDAITGMAVSVGHGTTTITATVGEVHGTATLNVNLSPAVASVIVSPVNSTVDAIGATQQFTAQAFDASGAPLPGVTFEWRSSAPSVATIDASTGLATGLANGNTTITAAIGDIAGTATLTVQQQVTRVAVTPGSATLTIGAALQFSAIAYDANDHVVGDVAFEWSSGDETVARIGTTGIAIAKAAGTASIRATAAGITGTASLVVSSP
jgi:uncharacterized protein YjdB